MWICFCPDSRAGFPEQPAAVFRISLVCQFQMQVAFSTCLNEFRFFTSARVPNVSVPFGLMEILASHLKLPSSILPSQMSKIAKNGPKLPQISSGFFSGADIRFTDNLHQGYAGSVEINHGSQDDRGHGSSFPASSSIWIRVMPIRCLFAVCFQCQYNPF